MSKQHLHACYQCGEQWRHAQDRDATSEQFHKAHTCPNGHEVTLKYTPEVADGLTQVCKTGGDALQFLKARDPVSYVTLSHASDKELQDALDEMHNAGPIFGEVVFLGLPQSTRDKIDAYAQELSDASDKMGAVSYDV